MNETRLGKKSLLGGMRGRSAAALWIGAPEAVERAPVALEVALVWGDALLEALRIADGEVTIGDAPGCTIAAPLAGRHVLAVVRRGATEILPMPGMQVERWTGGVGQRCTTSFALGASERAIIRLGALELVLRPAAEAEAVGRGASSLDLTWGRALSFSAMGASFLLAVVGVTPPHDTSLEDPLFSARSRDTLFAAPPEPRKLPVEARIEIPPASSTQPQARFQQRQPPSKAKNPGAKRESDLERIQGTGLLGALRDAGGAAGELLAGTGLNASIGQATDGLRGSSIGSGHGFGGTNSRGVGPGGGGSSLSLGTIGTGLHGNGPGGGGIELGAGSKARTRIIPGETRVVGGLGKDVIGDYIQKRWAEIRYCYERELQRNPQLQGKVAILFTIGATGSVVSADATEDTVGDGAVGRCIEGKVRRWRFPEPKGGGEVVVTYPWIFRAAGQ